jgi:hypothetical protein
LSSVLRRARSNPVTLIYWGRASLAALVAIVNTAFGLTDISGLVVGIGGYLSSYYVIRYVLKIHPEDVGGTTKLYTIGVGAYSLLFLFLWTLLYTISGVSF